MCISNIDKYVYEFSLKYLINLDALQGHEFSNFETIRGTKIYKSITNPIERRDLS